MYRDDGREYYITIADSAMKVYSATIAISVGLYTVWSFSENSQFKYNIVFYLWTDKFFDTVQVCLIVYGMSEQLAFTFIH